MPSEHPCSWGSNLYLKGSAGAKDKGGAGAVKPRLGQCRGQRQGQCRGGQAKTRSMQG